MVARACKFNPTFAKHQAQSSEIHRILNSAQWQIPSSWIAQLPLGPRLHEPKTEQAKSLFAV
jgi:hypothetical protein